jgi:hypothetical protein
VRRSPTEAQVLASDGRPAGPPRPPALALPAAWGALLLRPIVASGPAT